jgi:hypothetical protein
VSREAAYSALFAKLQGAAGFTTYSRVLRHWNDVGPGEQPALFQAQRDQEIMPRSKGLPPKRVLRAQVYVYVWSQDPTVSPSIALNNLIDAVEASLDPDPVTNAQTLGGLVSHCWIEGSIETDEGTLGQQAVAIIPINILVP